MWITIVVQERDKMNKLNISEAELEVMKVLWDFGEITSAEIVEKVSEKNEWSPKTIRTLINRLVEKSFVTAEKTETKAYLYKAGITKDEYRSYANKNFLKKVYDGSLNMMLASFVKEAKLTEKDIEELKNILEKK